MTASYMSGERKSKSRHTKNAYTKHMYTFWKVSGGFSNKMKGSKLNINEWNATRGKYCHKKKTSAKGKSLTECLYDSIKLTFN